MNPMFEPREVKSDSKPRRLSRWLRYLALLVILVIVTAVLVITLPNINFGYQF